LKEGDTDCPRLELFDDHYDAHHYYCLLVLLVDVAGDLLLPFLYSASHASTVVLPNTPLSNRDNCFHCDELITTAAPHRDRIKSNAAY
jgi:hypothetical protein